VKWQLQPTILIIPAFVGVFTNKPPCLRKSDRAAMKPIPVIAIFDIGKTNKKLFLFDEDYHIVFERSDRFKEIEDEDGFPCEDLDRMEHFIFEGLQEIEGQKKFDLKAVNFSAYGASLVYLDEQGNCIAPLYNYLKPYPEKLEAQFYQTYGAKENFSVQTASPALGSLNSGLQLYRVKYERPELFKKIKYALHLPQYLARLVNGQKFSDLTSIGCHTALWDFSKNDYHQWVYKEEIACKLAPIKPSGTIVPTGNYKTGIGLHDSSAALIPYLLTFKEPFVLISTGTWSISLNPFNQSSLKIDELKRDCLNYMQYNGKPVKAARFFIGPAYEEGLKQLSVIFKADKDSFAHIQYDPAIAAQLTDTGQNENGETAATLAFYKLMAGIVEKQRSSTDLILAGTSVKQLFVDGGFSQNEVFMHLLAKAYPRLKVYSAFIPQSTALGAALAIHQHWNNNPVSARLIQLKYYPA
jgi:sugar (pentulose or hexulose) kinase